MASSWQPRQLTQWPISRPWFNSSNTGRPYLDITSFLQGALSLRQPTQSLIHPFLTSKQPETSTQINPTHPLSPTAKTSPSTDSTPGCQVKIIPRPGHHTSPLSSKLNSTTDSLSEPATQCPGQNGTSLPQSQQQ